MTRREQIVHLLSLGRYTPKDLAKTVGLKIADVLDDIEHIRKSHGKSFVVSPAYCDKCDYTFEDRKRINTPSRCPECKAERVAGPWFSIEEKQKNKSDDIDELL